MIDGGADGGVGGGGGDETVTFWQPAGGGASRSSKASRRRNGRVGIADGKKDKPGSNWSKTGLNWPTGTGSKKENSVPVVFTAAKDFQQWNRPRHRTGVRTDSSGTPGPPYPQSYSRMCGFIPEMGRQLGSHLLLQKSTSPRINARTVSRPTRGRDSSVAPSS